MNLTQYGVATYNTVGEPTLWPSFVLTYRCYIDIHIMLFNRHNYSTYSTKPNSAIAKSARAIARTRTLELAPSVVVMLETLETYYKSNLKAFIYYSVVSKS